MSIRVEYYAILREQAGCDSESVDDAATPRDVYTQLVERHGFDLESARLRVAVNDRFADWDSALADGDRVVFIPPVAGG